MSSGGEGRMGGCWPPALGPMRGCEAAEGLGEGAPMCHSLMAEGVSGPRPGPRGVHQSGLDAGETHVGCGSLAGVLGGFGKNRATICSGEQRDAVSSLTRIQLGGWLGDRK